MPTTRVAPTIRTAHTTARAARAARATRTAKAARAARVDISLQKASGNEEVARAVYAGGGMRQREIRQAEEWARGEQERRADGEHAGGGGGGVTPVAEAGCRYAVVEFPIEIAVEAWQEGDGVPVDDERAHHNEGEQDVRRRRIVDYGEVVGGPAGGSGRAERGERSAAVGVPSGRRWPASRRFGLGGSPQARSSSPNSTQTQLNSTRLDSTRLDSTPLHSTPLNSTQLHSTPLHSTPLRSGGTWEAAHAGGMTKKSRAAKSRAEAVLTGPVAGLEGKKRLLR